MLKGENLIAVQALFALLRFETIFPLVGEYFITIAGRGLSVPGLSVNWALSWLTETIRIHFTTICCHFFFGRDGFCTKWALNGLYALV
jgi:hypothetical protein